jgi:hypothetical protein
MADQADKPTPGKKSPDTDTIFDNEIGDDWGEVFAAEDDIFAAENGANESFFLEEDGAASPSPAAERTEQGPETTSGNDDNDTRPGGPVSFTARLFAHGTLYRDKFQAFSLTVRLTAGVVVTGVLVFLLFVVHPGHKSIRIKTIAPSAPVTKPEPAIKISPVVNPSPTVNRTPQPPTIPISPEKVDKKWPLPSFFIAVSGEHGKKTAILTVDLTLFLLLPKGELPPKKHEILTRDIIYQFFNNQPLAEIRRYSLARGDMKRKLRAWIAKQLPKLPLSTIAFNRYQIL